MSTGINNVMIPMGHEIGNKSLVTSHDINDISSPSDIDSISNTTHENNDEIIKKSSLEKPRTTRIKRKTIIHFISWLTLTGFLCTAFSLQIPKGYTQELLILGIIYLWICLYLFFCYIPTKIITEPFSKCTITIQNLISNIIPDKRIRTIGYAIIVACIISAVVFSSPEKAESSRIQRLISLFGISVFLTIAYISSTHRKYVPFNTVISAMLLQFLLALFVFRTSVGHDIFQWIADFVENYLHYAYYGTEFIFGKAAADANTFALNVFPALIFFSSTAQILHYLGTIQWILKRISVVFMSFLSISGAETITVITTPFLGTGECLLLIEPLIPTLTKSEIHQILTSGFATISGSVMYGYIAMGVSGEAILTSCIMSIPCSIAISKLRYPEIEQVPVSQSCENIVSKKTEASNILHAAGIGAEIGVKISLIIMANIITILGILYAVNGFLTWLGHFINIQELTLQLITGYMFVPIAWLIGVDNKDLVIVGRLMATKIWSNEFIAYKDLTSTYISQLSPRSLLLSTYALCGYANIGSVGMQIGIFSSFVPAKAGEISELAISAVICGTISTLVSASIAGMLI